MLRVAELAANAKVINLEAASYIATSLPPVVCIAAYSTEQPLGLQALHALLQAGALPASAGMHLTVLSHAVSGGCFVYVMDAYGVTGSVLPSCISA